MHKMALAIFSLNTVIYYFTRSILLLQAVSCLERNDNFKRISPHRKVVRNLKSHNNVEEVKHFRKRTFSNKDGDGHEFMPGRHLLRALPEHVTQVGKIYYVYGRRPDTLA